MREKPPAFGEVGGAPVCGTASLEADTDLVVPTIAEPEAQPDTATATGDTENDWLCAWCHHRVANDKDRFPYNLGRLDVGRMGRQPWSTRGSQATLGRFACAITAASTWAGTTGARLNSPA